MFFPPQQDRDLTCPDAPWDWNIYLHLGLKCMVNVGEYSIHGAYGG